MGSSFRLAVNWDGVFSKIVLCITANFKICKKSEQIFDRLRKFKKKPVRAWSKWNILEKSVSKNIQFYSRVSNMLKIINKYFILYLDSYLSDINLYDKSKRSVTNIIHHFGIWIWPQIDFLNVIQADGSLITKD